MWRRATMVVFASALFLFTLSGAAAQEKPSTTTHEDKVIPPGAKVYIAPMDNGFETYLAAGIIKKNVPVVITTLEDKADFVISGISSSERAGWAKMLFAGNDRSNDQASIKIANRKTGVVAFAYAAHKGSSVHGAQSAAEACAKHLKEKIESRR